MRSAMLKLYKQTCPLCGRQATEIDHIFPGNAFEDFGALFEIFDIHADDNSWVLCTKCHSEKTRREIFNYKGGDQVSITYNKYWKLAFSPAGKRRFWNGKLSMIGVRARRNKILLRNRQRAAAKKAA